MAVEFKQCPNGHYYQGVSCPYCKANSGNAGNKTAKTEAFVDNDFENSPISTEMQYDGEKRDTVFAGQEPFGNNSGRNISPANRTVFGDENEIEITSTGQRIEKKIYRESRKLVGWLVTYSLDTMGTDYKLYEGRNIIGHDSKDCNIVVNDNMMSSKHATLLFRANKYSITDNQSSHGTFVNDEDIELAPRHLNDGDMIRMGETIFRFRTSL